MGLLDGEKTIREAFVEASSFLSRRGVEEANASAELLLQHLLGWSRSKLLLHWQEPFPSDLELEWQKLLSRRGMGEPVQYLMGEQAFFGLIFAVSPAVLIPRPETEILVQEIIRRGRSLWPDGEPLFADIGAGSGAIPVSVAVNCPRWRIAASDISKAALDVARGNALRHGVGERIRWLEGDLLAPLIREGLEPDIITSNPPYIRSSDIQDLQREVKDYEPHLALDGGKDGLFFYRRLAAEIRQLPKPPRLVGFEVGMGQAADVAAMLEGIGAWPVIGIVKDLSGIERHVVASRE